MDIRNFIQPLKRNAEEPQIENLHQHEIRLAVEKALKEERQWFVKVCERAVDGYIEVHTPAAKAILDAARSRCKNAVH